MGCLPAINWFSGFRWPIRAVVLFTMEIPLTLDIKWTSLWKSPLGFCRSLVSWCHRRCCRIRNVSWSPSNHASVGEMTGFHSDVMGIFHEICMGNHGISIEYVWFTMVYYDSMIFNSWDWHILAYIGIGKEFLLWTLGDFASQFRRTSKLKSEALLI